jgi:hypothetical protein
VLLKEPLLAVEVLPLMELELSILEAVEVVALWQTMLEATAGLEL